MRHILKFGLAFLLLFTTPQIFAQTQVPSVISTDQVWTPAGNPYLIDMNTLLDDGVKLTIQPGVVIEASNNSSLQIEGTFRAEGQANNPISISKLEMKFTQSAAGYDASSGTGSLVSHCNIIGRGSGSRAIVNSGIDLMIDHCTFTEAYYAIYGTSSQDSVDMFIENCKFYGTANHYGYPLYISGQRYQVNVTDCYFTNSYNLYVYGSCDFRENVFYDIRKVYFTLYGHGNFECNLFQNMPDGVYFNLYGFYDASLTFKDNTLDSCGGSSYPMLKVSLTSGDSLNNKVEVRNNNFLYSSRSGPRVEVSGSNSDPATYVNLDFSSNYWNSTDTSVIKASIYDYTDNIQVIGKVNYDQYQNSMYTYCTNLADSATLSAPKVVAKAMNIYPNPVEDHFTLDIDRPASQCVIRSLDGRDQMQLKVIDGVVDASSLSNGMYILWIADHDGNWYFSKIVKI